jgi:sterol desaturase/sphingolipid hydroxylase (fatty acid hydroxylase superfamily)
MFTLIQDSLSQGQSWLFGVLIQPVLFYLGMGNYIEMAFDGTETFIYGLAELAFLALVLGGLERWRPAEVQNDRSARRVDFIYTCIHRLGLFPLFAFVALTPVFDAIEGQLRLWNVSRPNLEQWLQGLSASPTWQAFFDTPLVGFVLYLVVLDVADYWIHRAQHQIEPWWQLHAVHHSQRSMNLWSDNRNHFIDDVLRDVLMAGMALVLGASPAQYVGLVVFSRMLQSLQHANVRLRFGAIGERLLVSPSFHRLHHGIGVGHEGASRGCNFSVLFPIWDVLFGTADFRPGFVPTGIRDQLSGKEYGRGLWPQQVLGFKRMISAMSRPKARHL